MLQTRQHAHLTQVRKAHRKTQTKGGAMTKTSDHLLMDAEPSIPVKDRLTFPTYEINNDAVRQAVTDMMLCMLWIAVVHATYLEQGIDPTKRLTTGKNQGQGQASGKSKGQGSAVVETKMCMSHDANMDQLLQNITPMNSTAEGLFALHICPLLPNAHRMFQMIYPTVTTWTSMDDIKRDLIHSVNTRRYVMSEIGNTPFLSRYYYAILAMDDTIRMGTSKENLAIRFTQEALMSTTVNQMYTQAKEVFTKKFLNANDSQVTPPVALLCYEPVTEIFCNWIPHHLNSQKDTPARKQIPAETRHALFPKIYKLSYSAIRTAFVLFLFEQFMAFRALHSKGFVHGKYTYDCLGTRDVEFSGFAFGERKTFSSTMLQLFDIGLASNANGIVRVGHSQTLPARLIRGNPNANVKKANEMLMTQTNTGMESNKLSKFNCMIDLVGILHAIKAEIYDVPLENLTSRPLVELCTFLKDESDPHIKPIVAMIEKIEQIKVEYQNTVIDASECASICMTYLISATDATHPSSTPYELVSVTPVNLILKYQSVRTDDISSVFGTNFPSDKLRLNVDAILKDTKEKKSDLDTRIDEIMSLADVKNTPAITREFIQTLVMMKIQDYDNIQSKDTYNRLLSEKGLSPSAVTTVLGKLFPSKVEESIKRDIKEILEKKPKSEDYNKDKVKIDNVVNSITTVFRGLLSEIQNETTISDERKSHFMMAIKTLFPEALSFEDPDDVAEAIFKALTLRRDDTYGVWQSLVEILVEKAGFDFKRDEEKIRTILLTCAVARSKGIRDVAGTRKFLLTYLPSNRDAVDAILVLLFPDMKDKILMTNVSSSDAFSNFLVRPEDKAIQKKLETSVEDHLSKVFNVKKDPNFKPETALAELLNPKTDPNAVFKRLLGEKEDAKKFDMDDFLKKIMKQNERPSDIVANILRGTKTDAPMDRDQLIALLQALSSKGYSTNTIVDQLLALQSNDQSLVRSLLQNLSRPPYPFQGYPVPYGYPYPSAPSAQDYGYGYGYYDYSAYQRQQAQQTRTEQMTREQTMELLREDYTRIQKKISKQFATYKLDDLIHTCYQSMKSIFVYLQETVNTLLVELQDTYGINDGDDRDSESQRDASKVSLPPAVLSLLSVLDPPSAIQSGAGMDGMLYPGSISVLSQSSNPTLSVLSQSSNPSLSVLSQSSNPSLSVLSLRAKPEVILRFVEALVRKMNETSNRFIMVDTKYSESIRAVTEFVDLYNTLQEDMYTRERRRTLTPEILQDTITQLTELSARMERTYRYYTDMSSMLIKISYDFKRLVDYGTMMVSFLH